MNAFLFDTCFLIDFERELRRGAGRAQGFLAAHGSARPWVCWTVAGEFAEGFGSVRHPACVALLGRFDMLPMDEETADRYGRMTAYLRREGRLIGTNDLWIAAAALAHGMPVVTRNADQFQRVPDLSVVTY